MSKYLITNEEYHLFLSNISIRNQSHGCYKFLNTHLYDCRIKGSGEMYFSSIENMHSAIGKIKESSSSYYVTPDFEKHPVVCVNWYGAELFASSLGFYLPSILEWETAAIGYLNPNSQYTWGDTPPTKEKANYGELVGRTTDVGSYPQNSFGLYDMLGNVREWTRDSPSGNIYAKLIKGGAWNKSLKSLDIKSNQETWILHSSASIGFRVCAPYSLKYEKN